MFIVSQLGSESYSDFRAIAPIDLDPGLISDYVKAMSDDLVLHEVLDEIETRYEEMDVGKKDRIQMALELYEDILWFKNEDDNDGL